MCGPSVTDRCCEPPPTEHMYACICTHVHIHVCTHMHTCMHKHTHTCIHTYTCIHTHTHTHTHAQTYIHTPMHTPTHTRVHTQAHTHIDRLTCIHTHTHISVQTGSQKRTGKGLPVLPLKQSHTMLVCSTMPGSHLFKVECGIQNKAKITFIL